MCAIAGILNLPLPPDTRERMLQTMARRGPDEQGFYEDNAIHLLHTRLSIIDPEGGKQPMVLRRNGQHLVLVYNGELYNTEAVRRDLVRLGHAFEGHSDTEVVLHAYAEFGQACVDRLNGIFAFGVWDVQKQTLFLARDRIGVKPLYFTETQGGLIFASEMKTILTHPAVKPVLDADGIGQLLLLGPGKKPGSGVFSGIRELEPGYTAMVKDGKLQLHRYWKLTDGKHSEDFQETAAHVRQLVTDAITAQMVSDVPIGTFLSGGLDSSLISTLCSRAFQERGQILKTFSLDYEKNDRYFTPGKFQPTSDSHYIRIMQEAIGSEPHWTVLTAENLRDALEDATLARDLPGMADVDFSLLCFCGEIRKEVKVALSGECADEIFGGYPWYRDKEVRERAGFPWAQNSAQRGALLVPEVQRVLEPQGYVRDIYETACRESDILPGTSALEKRMKEMVNLNFRFFMQTLLDRKDRMSMYHGLEVRVPFCDYRIAEYLYRVPWEMKDYQGEEKGLLRYAFRDVLPEAVLHRKKSPYPKTFDPEYARLMKEDFDRLMHQDSPLFCLVDKNKLREILETTSPWPWYGQLMKGPQTMAYFLQLDFWLKHYGVEIRI